MNDISGRYGGATNDLTDDSDASDTPVDTGSESADTGGEVSSEAALETPDEDSSDMAKEPEASDALEDDAGTGSGVDNSEPISDSVDTGGGGPPGDSSGSAGSAAEDKTDAGSDAPLEEETSDTADPASAAEGAEGTEKTDEDSADRAPGAALEEETSDTGEPASTEDGVEATEKTDKGSNDRAPDAPLEDESGDTGKPASTQDAANSIEKEAEGSDDMGSDAALEEKTSEATEPASAETATESRESVDEDRTEAHDAPEAAGRDSEEKPDTDSEGSDVKRARDMVSPEEYRQYPKTYDMLDERRQMPISPKFKKLVTGKFADMDVDTKGWYDGGADRFKCGSSQYHGSDGPHFNPDTGEFVFNEEVDKENPRGSGYTYFHEMAHNRDCIGDPEEERARRLSGRVREDLRSEIEQIKQEKHCDDLEAMEELGTQLGSSPDTSHTVADVFRGAGLSQVPGFNGEYEFTPELYHHSNTYWQEPAHLGQEALAGIAADRALHNDEALACARRYMPRTTKAAERIIRGGL
jgi:hypothetical protein